MRRHIVVLAALGLIIACDSVTGPDVAPPANLSYQLEPSGDPEEPLGVLLFWDAVLDDDLQVYRVYSRPDLEAVFGLRGETTSITFHDNGIPDLEYFVVAVDLDGDESAPSESVIIDERLRLERPDFIVGTSLDGAVYLAWGDNPFINEPDGFKQYRVYGASYSIDDVECGADWSLEGTTVAPEFLVGMLANGVSRCFAVSAESIEGFESRWSDLWGDTPRPDARNIVMTAFEADPQTAGFRFWEDVNGDGEVGALELGIVADGSRTDIDFQVTRDSNGNFFLVPVRTGTEIALYSQQAIADLTSIDLAPVTGYSPAALQALPQFGYVFQMEAGDQFARFGAIRVTHVGQDYMIFDWSYQTDPGNPELSIGAGIKAAAGTGLVIRR
ncbi:MAG: hypothetical protein GTN62_00415 [Gemmatimonadales bacterium]|nr:hypothetical protein [Gemmatimonadales bacterium]NIN09867.1 hypothetical protein [Gemmatimonadales bacterium]NIN48571.1 hypothetical protein [Gemmatimonadales bacterium]NIP06035.1 hypothetical protein [Gemmatimonadales bacterium]NIR01181.1 hypothetical protein [Gemmatimonadales bacterium]